MSKFDKNAERSYLKYLYANKDVLGLSWEEIAECMNDKFGSTYTESKYRKQCKRDFIEDSSPQHTEEPSIDIQLQSDVQRLKDERTQLNALYRQVGRENYLRDIAIDCAKIVAEKLPFKNHKVDYSSNSSAEGILLLSDWHYGISVDNHWNYYNPEVCEERLESLVSIVGEFSIENCIKKLNILNLGDLISGRIHSQIRIENKEDVISQVIHVSELLANFIETLINNYGIVIDYYDCLDNHSRVEPNKKESLRLESLARIITWYLDERFKNIGGVNINFNKYSDDILTFKCLNWNVAGVHGDLDSPKSVVKNLQGMVDEKPDLICTAHLHHFSVNEESNCVVVSNPSLMGMDQYAESKRFSSKPAQTLIIANEQSPVYAIHRIVLE